MWTYNASTGVVTDANDNVQSDSCYSGNGPGLNDPAMEQIHDVGPIPRGEWIIGNFFDDPGGKGPIVCHLTPMDDTDTFGRDGFMIHGDNAQGNFSASHGCVIVPRFLRVKISQSNDRILKVV